MKKPIAIELINVGYSINANQWLVKDLSLKVVVGETLVLLGQSGSGKTTTLKLINQLRRASCGEMFILGKNINDWDITKLRRQIGYVIQEGGLFPHYTVEKNIALLPELTAWSKADIKNRVQELMELIGLSYQEFAKRYPHQLSGGQRQRVGVARALALDPPIILLDEPFGALDPIIKNQLQNEFARWQQSLNKTAVLVTHDIQEAFKLADKIGLMVDGKLVVFGTKEDLLNSQHIEAKAFMECLRK